MENEIKCQECNGMGAEDFEVPLHPCAKCSGKGEPTKDVIMMIVYELSLYWNFNQGSGKGGIQKFKEEHSILHLTKSFFLLLSLANVLRVELKKHTMPRAWVQGATLTQMTTGILRSLLRPDVEHKERVQTVYHELIGMCEILDIDIDSHIQAYKDKSNNEYL